MAGFRGPAQASPSSSHEATRRAAASRCCCAGPAAGEAVIEVRSVLKDTRTRTPVTNWIATRSSFVGPPLRAIGQDMVTPVIRVADSGMTS